MCCFSSEFCDTDGWKEFWGKGDGGSKQHTGVNSTIFTRARRTYARNASLAQLRSDSIGWLVKFTRKYTLGERERCRESAAVAQCELSSRCRVAGPIEVQYSRRVVMKTAVDKWQRSGGRILNKNTVPPRFPSSGRPCVFRLFAFWTLRFLKEMSSYFKSVMICIFIYLNVHLRNIQKCSQDKCGFRPHFQNNFLQ